MKLEAWQIELLCAGKWFGFEDELTLVECMAISSSEDEELFHAKQETTR